MRKSIALSLAFGSALLSGALGVRAVAHNHELTPEERAAFKSAVATVGAAVKERGPREHDILDIDVELKPVATDVLPHVDELPEFQALDDSKKDAVVRAMRSVVYLRRLRARSKHPEALAFWLGDESPKGVSSAIQALCAEPSGDEFRQVVTLLSTDARPEIRLGAGIAAKLGVLFEGPHPAYTAIAQNLLVDADPRVAAQFGRWHCCDFGDPKLIDKMVDRLGDSRPLTSQPLGFLISGETTVSAALVNGLDAFLFLHNDFLHGNRDRALDLASTKDISVIRKTWESDRDLWLGRKNTSRYEKIFDGIVDLDVGKVKKMTLGKRSVSVCLRTFRLETGDCQPTPTMALEMEDSEATTAEKFTVNSVANQPFGTCAASENSVFTARALALPTPSGSCKVRLWLWFRTDPNLGDDE